MAVISLGLAHVGLPLGPETLEGQQGVSVDSLSVPSDVMRDEDPFREGIQESGISPGGAFLRSALVPGWGHVATQAYGRGGFYVAVQTGSLWMLLQTLSRRAEAREFRALEGSLAEARLIAGGTTDPDSLMIAVDADPLVQGAEALVVARDQQVEDWSAISIFLALLGGTDAFVAAHLADYPEPLTFRAVPVGGGRTELRLSIPVGHSRAGSSGRR